MPCRDLLCVAQPGHTMVLATKIVSSKNPVDTKQKWGIVLSELVIHTIIVFPLKMSSPCLFAAVRL